MTKPTILDFLLGNPFVVLLAFGWGALSGYVWLAEGGSWLWPLAAGMVALRATQAQARVEEYREWKAEWNGMTPQSGVPRSPLGILRSFWTRVLIGGPLLLYGTLKALSGLSDPSMQVPSLMFLMGVALVVGVPLWRRWKARPKAERRFGEVEVCSKPQKEVASGLPEYCRDLLNSK